MLEIKNSAKEVKNTFERLMNRLTEHDWRKTELKGIAIETFKTKKQTRKKTKQNTQELWDNYERCNIHVMGIPEG